MTLLIIILGLLTLVRAFPHYFNERLDSGKCGYDSCPIPKPGMLNVHLVPHTHDDVGWLKTVDQYYYGSKANIQNAGVQYILDSVIDVLSHDPKKKFIYVETAFFWKWWKEQDDDVKYLVKNLVNNGQLEFIGGAWSMNDEATTHYQSVIDQFTWGLRKLNDTFGPCGRPKIGWQIDPFGHSREMASMMAHFGFDGLFFGRLDYQDKENRLQKNTMEMIWEGDPFLGPEADLFTGVLFNLYQAPRGFCFDIMCGDEPIIDDPKSPDYNVQKRVNRFLDFIDWQSLNYRNTDIMITMGGDFNYLDAHHYFKNLEKLIRYINERQKSGSKINAFYSTPSCYLKSLNDANVTWPTKKDDFFPYASDPHAYWTGYFSSRPTLKRLEREGNNFLQVCKQLSSLVPMDFSDELDALREAMGIMQHHDAITGTEKQHVADDYARILSQGLDKCMKVVNTALNELVAKPESSAPPLTFDRCKLLNISECELSSTSEKFIVTVYNPLSFTVKHHVRLPIPDRLYTVKDSKGNIVMSQIVPIPDALVNMTGRNSETLYELVFAAENIPPLGIKSYYVMAKDGKVEREQRQVDDSEEMTIGYEEMSITINKTSGQLTSIQSKGESFALKNHFEYYISAEGNNQVFANRSSGAYIFRPKTSERHPINDNPKLIVYEGPVVTEIHVRHANWTSVVYRLYPNESYLESEWLVGPIPVSDRKGKEVISRYVTNLNTHGLFYTDSNGRQILERKRDYRPTWDVKLEEKVSGNYYPITSEISVRIPEVEMAVLVDRAEGGGSVEDGDFEIMLHRRILHDDAFGVDEALNEEAYGKGLIARGKHRIMFGVPSSPQWQLEKLAVKQKILLSPQIFLTDATSLDFEDWTNKYNTGYQGIAKDIFPAHILTLEPWRKNIHLLRLESLSEVAPDIEIDLSNLFSSFDVISAEETSLGADRWLNEVNRLKWRKETNEVFEENTDKRSAKDDFPIVKLSRKQIRTFLIEVKPKQAI